MSDIVERLRAASCAIGSLMYDDAADEITLLRQQLSSARDAALEEAAVAAERPRMAHFTDGTSAVLGKFTPEQIATAIRSLKSGQEGKR